MSNRSNMSLLIPAAALACALLGTTSCLRELFSFRSGSEIRFVAGTSGTNLSSKAAYSGSVSSGYERIDWEDGDLIRIHCAQASEPDTKWTDYVILDGTVESDGSVSSATIMPGRSSDVSNLFKMHLHM